MDWISHGVITPPRPSANLIRSSGIFVQMRPLASLSSNRESSTPSTTYSQTVTPDKCYNTASYPQYKILLKNLKIKWWKKYNFQHATIKHIKEWFADNGYLQDIDQRKNIEFLNDKSKLLAALAQATTDADF
ncbi:polyprotein [Cucumis melo var. makuwa]|uniref:Polyprotein n=1 Tax=Cucumis melo var. makuwa TaxID=1194695 RepID=A0A5A7UZX0_CUCMM|nr:polyprotein [Cucumis melo var. makuwa]